MFIYLKDREGGRERVTERVRERGALVHSPDAHDSQTSARVLILSPSLPHA